MLQILVQSSQHNKINEFLTICGQQFKILENFEEASILENGMHSNLSEIILNMIRLLKLNHHLFRKSCKKLYKLYSSMAKMFQTFHFIGKPVRFLSMHQQFKGGQIQDSAHVN